MIRRDYAFKCLHKHRIRPEQFALLPIIIDLGAAAYDNRRPRHLTFFFHEDVVFGSGFELGIKATSLGHELHVCTFHKISAAEYRRKQKKLDFLRDHPQEL